MITPRAILLVEDNPQQNRQDCVTAVSLGRDSERKRLVIAPQCMAMEARIIKLKAKFEIEHKEMEDAIVEAEGSTQTNLAGRVQASRQTEQHLYPAKQAKKNGNE